MLKIMGKSLLVTIKYIATTIRDEIKTLLKADEKIFIIADNRPIARLF